MSNKKNEIYNLELHDSCEINDYTCVNRVPGGWIYESFDPNDTDQKAITAVFVPYVLEPKIPRGE